MGREVIFEHLSNEQLKQGHAKTKKIIYTIPLHITELKELRIGKGRHEYVDYKSSPEREDNFALWTSLYFYHHSRLVDFAECAFGDKLGDQTMQSLKGYIKENGTCITGIPTDNDFTFYSSTIGENQNDALNRYMATNHNSYVPTECDFRQADLDYIIANYKQLYDMRGLMFDEMYRRGIL